MERFIPVIGILLIAFILIIDVLAHKKLLIRRRLRDWVFLCVLFVALLGGLLFAVYESREDTGSDDTGVYLAYRYLAEGDSRTAIDVIQSNDKATQEHRELVGVMAAAVNEDYEELFFSTLRYMRNDDYDYGQAQICTSLNELASRGLKGLKVSSTELDSLINKSFSQLNLGSSPGWELYYDIDRAVRLSAAEDVNEEDVLTIRRSFPEDREACLIAMNYYIRNNRFDEARQVALDLIEQKEEQRDYALLASLYMQEAYVANAAGLTSSEDSEISGYLEKAETAAGKAAQASGSKSRKEEYLEEADDNYREAARVVYRRVLNYIDSKQVVQRDDCGYLDLQKVKLELLLGEYDAACEDFDSLVNRSSDLRDTSVIKNHLINVESARRALYLASDAAEINRCEQALKKAVFDLIAAHALTVVPCDYENVNSESRILLYSLLKFKRPVVNFVKTATVKTGKVVFTMDFSFMKDGIFGSEQFYKDDVTLYINNKADAKFDMSAAIGASGRYLAVVAGLYHNESAGDGGNFRYLQETLKMIGRDEDLARHYVLVNSLSASEENRPTGVREDYMAAVRAMDPVHEEDVHANLVRAVNVMRNRTEDQRTLLFVTDDAEMAAEDLTDDLMQKAAEANIYIYVIVTGEKPENDTLSSRLSVYGGAAAFAEYGCAYEQTEIFITNLIKNRYVITVTQPETGEAVWDFRLEFNDLDVTAKTVYGKEAQ